jgi:hypothetical protein
MLSVLKNRFTLKNFAIMSKALSLDFDLGDKIK